MKGVNTLVLNEATMIEAMQYWLNSKLTGTAPIVTSVVQSKDVNYCKQFEVITDASDDAKLAAKGI